MSLIGGHTIPAEPIRHSRESGNPFCLRSGALVGGGVANPLPVILSEAKDLRSFMPFNELRTTAEILRFAQDDRGEYLSILFALDAYITSPLLRTPRLSRTTLPQ